MKAVVLSQYGTPEHLQLREVATPQPRPNEVLIKVHATAVNDWDWCFVRGKPLLYRLMVGGHLGSLLQVGLLGPILARLARKQIRILGLKPNQGLEYINRLFETVGIQCVIDGPYALRDVPAAVQRFGDAKHVGKIVVKVAS